MRFAQRSDWPAQPNILSAKLAVLKNEGKKLYDLTLSNPTAAGFEFLKAPLLEALSQPQNLTYTPDPHGLLEARLAVVSYYEARGIRLDLRQIFLTAGTSEAYTFIFRLLFEPGELLMVPAPSYPLLEYLTRLNDLKTETYSLAYQNGAWTMSLEKLFGLTELEPKGFLVVNPNNPTGNFIHSRELAELVLVAKSHNMALISDEVFFDFPFTRTAGGVSLAGDNGVLTFTLGGISKSLGLPQMKLSWLVISGPAKERDAAIEKMEIIADTYLSAGTPAQNALPLWLKDEFSARREILERVRANYTAAQNIFKGHPRVSLLEAEGGWTCVLKLANDWTDEEACLILLEKDQVLLHPGYLYDFENGNYLVASLLVPPQVFEDGMKKTAARFKS